MICCESLEQFRKSPAFKKIATELENNSKIESHIVLTRPTSREHEFNLSILTVSEDARPVFDAFVLPLIAVVREDRMGTTYEGTSTQEILELLSKKSID